MTIEDEMLGRNSGQTADPSIEDQMLAKPPGALKKLGGRIADVGLSTLKGAISVPEAIVGVGDLLTNGDVGRTAEDLGFRPKEAKEYLDTLYSDQQKAANAEVDQAKGFLPTVGAMVQNPSTIAHAALESAPSMLPGAAVARGIMKAAPTVGPIAAGAIGEGVVAGGLSAEQVRQQDPNGTLTNEQSAILAGSGGLTGAIGFGSGKLANKLGIGELSTMLAAGRLGAVGQDAIEAGAKKGIMRKIGEGALVEGVLQELPQSYQEQVAQNLAQGKPWDEGAAEAGAQGMLAGGLMGAVGGPLRSSPAPNPNPPPGEPSAPLDIAPAGPVPGAPADPTGPAPVPPAGPLTRAASLGPTAGAAPRSQLPFSSMDVAQKQADAMSQSTGIPHEATEHPSVPGRFAAVPAGISGADSLFLSEAKRQGVDPALAQLSSQGAGAQKLLADTMAAFPDIDAQQWRDPAMRAQLGAAYLKQHTAELGEALGHTPSPAEHYIAQQLGMPAATAMLTMPEAERSMPVSAVISDPALEDRLGVTGMPISDALTMLTQQAEQLLATMKGNGNANLGTDLPGTQSGTGRPGAGPAMGDAVGNATVPERPATGAGTLAGSSAAGIGDHGSQPDGAGAIASPRSMVGPTESGYQNVNAQRHRDTADNLGLTAKIESHFGAGLTVNQVVGQIADQVPGMVPADLPNFVNGVRQTLGIPAPISPEGKGAFDAWRAEYKARQQQPAAAPVAAPSVTHALDEAAHGAATSPLNALSAPSEKQRHAGNYQKGHVTLQGLNLSIENPTGSTRSGTDPDGKPWQTTMAHHYGYIKGTSGADNEHIDTFVGPNPDSGKVFVVDQTDGKTGGFDEHKVMLGFDSLDDARQAYAANYAPDWKGGEQVAETSMDGFKQWMKEGDTSAPFAAPTPTGPITSETSAPPGSAGAPLSQEDYANELEQGGLPAGVSAYDSLTSNSSTRGMTAQERMDLLNAQRPAMRAFRERVEAVWRGHKDAVQDGITPMGADSGWTSGWASFEIGDDTHAKGTERHKSYASLDDFINISEVDMSGFLVAMRDAGFNGQVKFPALGERALLGSDNVVMHGATEEDAKTGEAVARQFFGDRVTGTQFGKDADGKSHTQMLAERVEKNLKTSAPAADAVVSKGDADGKARIDYERLVFTGAVSGFDVSDELKAKVQAALRTRPDTYETGRYAKNDTRLSLPSTHNKITSNGGQFQVTDNGRVSLMGDDGYGWASTMSQRSVTRTLTDWLKNMGKAPASTGTGTPAPDSPFQPNEDAIAHPEKYGFKGELPKTRIVQRAVEHIGDEDKFLQMVQVEFLEHAEQGYPVLPTERNDMVAMVADEVLAGNRGDKPAYYWEHPEFDTVPELEGTAFPRKEDNFPAPAQTVVLENKLRGEPFLTQQEAAARVAEWKAEAKRIGREHDNSKKVVISLFDRSGVMSQPYEDAGYTVFRYDLERGHNLLKDFPIADIVMLQESGHEIVGVLSQPPCTSFSRAGAQFWPAQHDQPSKYWIEKKYGAWAADNFDTPLEVADMLVLAARTVVEFANPSEFYTLENPIGRIARVTGLPKPTLKVHPNHFGDAYTKSTLLWGEFDTDLPTAYVSANEADGGEGSKIHKLRGTDEKQKEARSLTPEGFAYAFFMANHKSATVKLTDAAQPAPADAKAGEHPPLLPIERRKARDKHVDEMTPEEKDAEIHHLRKESLTNPKSRMGNEKAYNQSLAHAQAEAAELGQPAPIIASIDLDSLGWINDNMGHDSGDKFLSLAGSAFGEYPENVFHTSGDELKGHFPDEQTAKDILAKVRQRLEEDAVIKVTKPDGSVVIKEGIGFSYGLGKDFTEADEQLYSDKADRQQQGRRAAKGAEPPGVSRIAAEGQQDNGSVPATEEVTPPVTIDQPGDVDTAPPAPAIPDTPPAGKEVSRFSGKYGKGMSQPNAQMAANNRAKADPANNYTVEERDDGRFDVVGREKPAPAALPGLAKMQAAKADQVAAVEPAAEPTARPEPATATVVDNTATNPNEYIVRGDGHNLARFEIGKNDQPVHIKYFFDASATRAEARRAIDDFVAQRKESAPTADRDTIAKRYAAVLAEGRDGVSDEVKDFHLRFADDVLAKNAYGLKWIANGLNDKGKKVFAEFTGVKLPRGQAASWAAVREWAGVTPEQDAQAVASAEAARVAKQQAKDDDAAENDAELQRFQVSATDTRKISGKEVVDSWIADGYNAIENISKTPIPKYVLVNKELGRFYPLDKVARKYAEVALRRLGKSDVAQDTDGDALVSVEDAAAEQAEYERELADAKAKGQTMASDDDIAHLFGKTPASPAKEDAGTRNDVAVQAVTDNTVNADKSKDDNGTGPAISDLGAPGIGQAGRGMAAGQQERAGSLGALASAPAEDDGDAGRTERGRAAGARPPGQEVPRNESEPGRGDGADRRNGTSGTGLADAGTGVGGPAVGPARANYHIGDPEQLIGGTPKVRFANNRRAIEAYRSITEEGRAPVKADLDAMAAYIGWGSFGQELFKGTWAYPSPKEGWTSEDTWLRNHLGQAEWESAQRSIINAHYTDPITVNTMWDMVRALGFNGGRVLEPSMGIGNFFAMMPLDLAGNSQLTGIELDTLTGGMAKELYPNANIQIKGYEASKTADDFYDLVIGNWPFAKDGPSDRRYMKLNPSLHDFFFLKALDQTRPGGLVVGITSAGTMDKKGRATRMEIAKKGELVAAFRLPSGAFEKYAGTAVVTDIIVLRKRDEPTGIRKGEEQWIDLAEVTAGGNKFEVNSYYVRHSDHVLGTLNYGHGTTYGRPAMIVDRPNNLLERLGQLAGKMPTGTYLPATNRKQISYITNNTADREGSATLVDGKLYAVRGERLVTLDDEVNYRLKDAGKTAVREAEIGKLIAMRNAYGALVAAERAGDATTETLRKELKRQYTAFTKAHGKLATADGMRILEKLKDPYYYALASLEIDGKPARVLSEATLRGRRTLTNPSVRDAFVLARNESMEVNLPAIAKLAGKSEAVVAAELEKVDAIYKTPAGNYEVADIYLSGNVRRKLREAQEAQTNGDGNNDLARNIAALEKVLPKTVPYFKIEAKLGAPWIKAEHYQHFVSHLLGLTRVEDEAAIDVRMVNGAWKVKFTHPSLNERPEARNQWGTSRKMALLDKMLTAAMNNRSITVKYKDDNGNMVPDELGTMEVNEKLMRLREEFSNWVWKDAERRVWLEENYNEVMNAIATPSFDGAFLDFNGMALRRGNDPFSLRSHQVNAVWRGLVNGRGLYAHEVGTGKTYTMAGLAVESRRYGLAKKPLIFAHNANSATVAKEFNDMYPAARVLYIDNLAPDQIQLRMRQIANDDWDAIVVPHSLINRFALTEETLMEIAGEDIAAMEQEAMDAADDDGVGLTLAMMDDEDAMKKVRSATAKELVRSRNKIIKSIQDMGLRSTKEGAVSFEDMGIDMVIVDEAHEFKKPPVATKMKMRGLNTGTSNMAISLRFLTDFVKRENNGRGIHLFTGTPITNTLTELYNMMRYVMDDVMARDGIKDWDSWFNTFADSSTDVELTAAGDYEAVTRLASFVNTAELRRISGEFMDIVFADDMPEFKPRSTASGKTMSDELTDSEREELLNGRSENPIGRPYKKIIVDVAPLGREQKKMLDRFKSLATQFKQATKKERREMMLSGHPASPLLVETGASNAGMDPRLVDMGAADEKNSKVNRVVRNAVSLYNQDSLATQVVFLERGFVDEGSRSKTQADGTKLVTKVKKFNLVKDMVAKLVAAGVKPGEIAIVDGSTTKEKRKAIADAMNKSKIRIVIGNTKTLGVGVNMQANLRAMHHMDAPWMPGELEQRNGRGWRQGNQWNTVLEYRYITERLDGRRWQVVAVKDRFIKAFLQADENTRIIDGDAVELDEAESAGGDLSATLSEAAGDPRVLVREKLKADVEKLENRERQHTYALSDAAHTVRRLISENERMSRELPLLRADSAQYEAGRPNFNATIDGEQYDSRSDADEALEALVASMPESRKEQKAGTMHGFPITLTRYTRGADPVVEIHGKYGFTASKASTASIEATLRKIEKTIATYVQQIEDNKASIVRMNEVQKEPFGQADLLAKKMKMLAELKLDLAHNPEPAPSWLRHGAPANTLIYVKGKPLVVEGHKSGKGTYSLVTEAGDINYLDATDASGLPVFEPVDGVLRDGLNKRASNPGANARGQFARMAPLFSRGEAGTSMPVAGVRQVVDTIVKGWSNAPDVTVVQSVKDLPFDAPPDARGAFHQGRVWLVADNLHTAAEAQFAIGHEALGHLGLRAIMDARTLANEMNRLRMINPALASAARTQAAKFGYDLATATEEALADMAGSGATIKGWQKFIHTVQRIMRALGLNGLADWMEGKTAAETMDLLRRARAAIEGEPAPQPADTNVTPQFSDGAPTNWYSALARQLEKGTTKSASPLHWGQTIMSTSFAQQGIKQDEIEWSGVLDWLNMQQSAGVTKVSRDELLDYLATDGVRVSEVMRGAPEPASEAGLVLRKAVFDQYQPRIEAARARSEDYSLPSKEHDEARDELDELFTERDRLADEAYRLPADLTKDAKYEKYQLPGGTNYRELVMTLPLKKQAIVGWKAKRFSESTGADYDGWNVTGTMENGMTFRSEIALEDAATEGEAIAAAQVAAGTHPITNMDALYKSSHWDEPNVLAHVRFNERTDADGARVLFVEELQSDWAQQGKKQGFAGPPATQQEREAAAKATREADDALDAAKSLWAKYTGDMKYWTEKLEKLARDPRTAQVELDSARASLEVARDKRLAQDAVLKDAGNALMAAMNVQSTLERRGEGIARAPFVGKTDAWLSLAIKRVTSFAVQNGFDKVAFINGQQSADRYDLSTYVDQIRYIKRSNETYDVWAADAEGRSLNDTVDKQGLTPEQIENFIGKEMAQKIVDGVGRQDAGDMVLEGVDLKVGGEGMKAFYDTLVPNAVNAVLKKLGGGKVVAMQVDTASDAERPGIERASRLGKLQPEYGTTEQLGFTITDALREKAFGGLPLFSRNPTEISRQAGATIKALTVTSVKNKLVDHRDKVLMLFGRRQLKERYGHLFPQGTKPNLMESYNTLAMKMDAEKNEAGAAADALTNRWAKLQDHQALAELMHDSTRLQIDPSKPYVLGDLKNQYRELAGRYVALSDQAKEIFQEAARAYEKHYADVRAAVHDRIGRAMVGHPNQADMLTRMDGEFFGQIKGIYFPLARFGDYLVQVNWRGVGANPEQGAAREAVHFAETIAEAQELRNALLEKYPANKGYQVAEITKRAEYNAARDAVGRGFLQQMFNLFKTTGMDPSLQDAINQLYLTSLPDLSWAKHGIHRKGTPGFSQDARRAFAHHMFHGARYLAKLHYADQLTQDIDDMQHYVKAHAQDKDPSGKPTYDPVKAQQVVDEMLKRHEIYMNPKSNALSTALTSFGFVFFLGLSPASALVNLSQTALVAYPVLGGRYGFGKAGSALLTASKDAMRGHNDMSKVLSGDELLAYQGWVKTGLIDVSMAHDLAGISQGEDHKLWGKMRPVMQVASWMFHHAEKFNRQATALAAYRLARGKGMTHDEAYTAAVEDTYAGHFDYSAGNRPRIMQGAVARVVLLFKQYAQNMIYTFSSNAALAFKGDKKALKTLSGLLVSHALAAGILGLPLVNTLLAAASLLGSDDDEPWDAKIALRNMMADAFGNDAAEVMAHGLSRATPFDISSRVGLNQLLLPDVQEGLEGGRLAESYLVSLSGPIAGVAVNWGKGMHNILGGDVQRGLEQMVPAALRGPMKAIRYSQEGVKDRSGIDILPETTLTEELGQGFGLSPSRAREAQEGKSAIYKTDRALQRRRQELMSAYAHRVMNEEDPSEDIAAISAFNQLHPNRMIAPLHLVQSVRVRLQHQAQSEQGIFLPARRSDAREAGRFAEETP